MPNPELEAWREEQRTQWAVSNGLLAGIREAQGGLMTALEDLQAAVADNTEVSSRVGVLVDSLQDQVAALQQTVDDLIAQGSTELGPVTEQIQAITAALTAAEAPNEPAEEPVEEPVEEPPVEG